MLSTKERLERERDCLDYCHDLYVNARLMKDWKKADAYLANMKRSIREVEKLEQQLDTEERIHDMLKLHNYSSKLLKEGGRYGTSTHH